MLRGDELPGQVVAVDVTAGGVGDLTDVADVGALQADVVDDHAVGDAPVPDGRQSIGAARAFVLVRRGGDFRRAVETGKTPQS